MFKKKFIYIFIFLIVNLNGANDFLIKNNIVFDAKTKVFWLIQPEKTFNWKKSKDYCNRLEVEDYYYCNLPSIYLLSSLINYEGDKSLIRTSLLKITPNKYWSDTGYQNNKKQAWVMDFKTGKNRFYSIKKKFKIICICE